MDQAVRQPRQDRQREQADNHRSRTVDGVRRQPRVPASLDAGPQQHPGTAHRYHHGGELRDEMHVQGQVDKRLHRDDKRHDQ